MKTLYTKGMWISMLNFVKMQNWRKWQTDSCPSVQNAQKTALLVGENDNGPLCPTKQKKRANGALYAV